MDCLPSSRAYLLSTLVQIPCKSYNWLYSRGNIQKIYKSAFYAIGHSKLLLNVELEMDAGHSEPDLVSCWAVGSFGTSWGRGWGGSGVRVVALTHFNIGITGMAILVLLYWILVLIIYPSVSPCLLSLPSSFSHCFYEVNYRLHLISNCALNNG